MGFPFFRCYRCILMWVTYVERNHPEITWFLSEIQKNCFKVKFFSVWLTFSLIFKGELFLFRFYESLAFHSFSIKKINKKFLSFLCRRANNLMEIILKMAITIEVSFLRFNFINFEVKFPLSHKMQSKVHTKVMHIMHRVTCIEFSPLQINTICFRFRSWTIN